MTLWATASSPNLCLVPPQQTEIPPRLPGTDVPENKEWSEKFKVGPDRRTGSPTRLFLPSLSPSSCSPTCCSLPRAHTSLLFAPSASRTGCCFCKLPHGWVGIAEANSSPITPYLWLLCCTFSETHSQAQGPGHGVVPWVLHRDDQAGALTGVVQQVGHKALPEVSQAPSAG